MENKTPAAPPQPPQPPKPVHEGKALTTGGIKSLAPQTFAEAEHIAKILATSDLVPKGMIGKPANILLAIMYGAEIGISPAQALQNVMVINGRPSLWGDAVMGKVLASGFLETFEEIEEKDSFTYKVKRKGLPMISRTFSMDDARKAKLATKPGPWQEYPKRMLFHRARSWALRDAFADVLKGIRYYEEERDIVDMAPTPGQPGSFEMPGRQSEPAVEAPKPAVEPAKEAEVVDDPWTHYNVTAASKSQRGKETVFVIRVGDGDTKLFTTEPSIFELAKGAKEAKADFRVILEDRKGESWIVEAGAAKK